MTTPVSIAWALVGYGPIFPSVYTAHLRAIAKASRTLEVRELGSIGACGASDRTYTHSAENAIAANFLADPSLTHLYLTETDMLCPDDVIVDLLSVGQPIVSGLYFLRGGQGQPCLYKPVLRPTGAQKSYGMSPVSLFPTDAPFRLNGCPGLGCVLIAREVFEKVPYPWFDLAEGRYGSDLYFYTKCLDAGFDVWVNPRVRCGQIDYVVVSYDDYQQRLQTDPAFAGSGVLLGADVAQ
jgi:hypothetical protein